MKTKFTNSMCAHVWAQQKQQYGEGSNMNFDGPEIYSYSTTIAIHYNDFVLVSADTMTPTTAKHLCYVRRAVSDKRVIYTYVFEKGRYLTKDSIQIVNVIKDLVEQMRGTIQTANKRTSKSGLQWDITTLYNTQANIEFLQTRYNLTPVETPNFVHLINKLDTLKEKDNNREELKRKKEQAQFIQWLNGDEVRFPRSWDRRDGGDYITLRGETVITSRGAIAPLGDVKRAVRFYNSTPWPYFGRDVKLGEFTLNKIDVDGNVTAGCHVFKASEIERFILKWSV